MPKLYSIAEVFAALIFCGNSLSAQNLVPGGGHTGLQAYKKPQVWHGLDLKQFWGSDNTAIGSGALAACTSCYQNVADGFNALNKLTTGWGNTGVGDAALSLATTSSSNTAVGWAALDVSTANNNTAVGYAAMEANTTGGNNTAVGSGALGAETGGNNTAIGTGTMANSFTESYSTALGSSAMSYSNSSAGYNTVMGYQALYGAGGVMGGTESTGGYNVVAGAKAMYANTTGMENVALGYEALYENTTGQNNVATGILSAYSNTEGLYLVAEGFGAMYENTTGMANTAVGVEALYYNTTGNYNTGLGFLAGPGTGALTNTTALGYNASVSSSNAVVVGNSSVTTIGGYANWTNFSDGRYKKNIQSNVPGLAFINKLNPVTYTLDVAGIESKLHPGKPNLQGRTVAEDDAVMKQAQQEKAAVVYTGFVAQDVEKAADSLNFAFSGVDRPKDVNASFYGLRYGDFVPPLVKAVQELSAGSDRKDSAINVLQLKYDSLQTQVTELRAMFAAFKASAMSGASLDQNVPNPFNGSTVIGYSLPKGASSAQMQITDETGRVLAFIPLSTVSGGKKTLTADVSGYAAGTYAYTLIVDGKVVSTKQMISVR